MSCAKKGLAQGATDFANSSVHTDNMHSLTHYARKGFIHSREKERKNERENGRKRQVTTDKP